MKTSPRAFSLLETLIAAGILIIVVSAITALSNSLIAGTVNGSDRAITNRWAAEALELTKKIRDDSVKASQPIWLSQAENVNKYGWYVLQKNISTQRWELKVSTLPSANTLTAAQVINNAEPLTADILKGYRLVCVEAVGAVSDRSNEFDEDKIYCNTDQSNTVISSDGNRSNLVAPCDAADVFCDLTMKSVQENHFDRTKIIPAGSAVKIRAVVLWPDKDSFKTTSISTMLTNWKINGY